MPVADAISTGIKLASAIETAHRSGIVHRDIKPSNVLVTTYSEPALTDFGIAGGLHEVEGDHEVRISYPWSPPEMLDGRSNGSVASDVYSLGATIWHLLDRALTVLVPQRGQLHARPDRADPALHAAGAPSGPTCRPSSTGCCSSAWPSSPRTGRRSALELALGLQRIEAAAGFPRTPIAVEGGSVGRALARTGAARTPTPPGMKPPTVVSASQPRPLPAQAQRSVGRRSRRTGAVIWAALGTGALTAVGITLFLTAGGDGDRDPGVGPSVSSTHTPANPGRGRDHGPRRWSPGSATGRWVTVHLERRPTPPSPATPGSGPAPTPGRAAARERQSVRLRTPDRVCVQVRLVRGQFASPWADECVT